METETNHSAKGHPGAFLPFAWHPYFVHTCFSDTRRLAFTWTQCMRPLGSIAWMGTNIARCPKHSVTVVDPGLKPGLGD